MTSELIQVIQRLSRCSTLDGVLLVLRQEARALTGADGVTLVLREGGYCHYADEEAIAPLWKGRRFPLNSCISGWAMLHRRQVAIADIYADPRIPHDAYRPTFVRSLAMTPIRTEDPIGAIGAYWAREHQATVEELATLQTLGDSAAVAIAHVNLLAALKRANERKDAYLATLSHELRGPLAPIRNALELMERTDDSDKVIRLREIMKRQVQHLSRMLDDLLDVNRILRGKVELHRERVDLVALARQAVEDCRDSFQKAGIALGFESSGRELWVDGDATRLTQIVSNVLDNARKFTRSGGRVDVVVTRGDSGQAVVSVRDTGVGIAPEIMPQLFQVFAQADSSLDRATGGLGLGLTVARGLLDLHGGTIEVQSEGLDRGTTVTVRLPAAREIVAATNGGGAPHGSEKTHNGNGKARILIIEDNRDTADTLELLLRMSGHDASVAYTGPDGLRKAFTFRPSVVLCDLGLPGMDGYEIARTLRADRSTAAMRLIALTGYGQPEDRKRALEAGFDLHLVKPVDPARLLEHLGLQNRGETSN